MITPKEAFVYWSRAAGISYPQIAKRLEIKENYARQLFYAAVEKSRAAGVSYLSAPKKQPETPRASSSLLIAEAIQDQNVKLKGFAALKALAEEIAQETGKSRENEQA
jgi:DNA-binding CsgD family transcriptional regulator